MRGFWNLDEDIELQSCRAELEEHSTVGWFDHEVSSIEIARALAGWIAWNLAQSPTRETAWTRKLGSLLPIPMVLRELGVGADMSWERMLDSFLEKPLGKPLSAVDLERKLDAGDVLIHTVSF